MYRLEPSGERMSKRDKMDEFHNQKPLRSSPARPFRDSQTRDSNVRNSRASPTGSPGNDYLGFSGTFNGIAPYNPTKDRATDQPATPGAAYFTNLSPKVSNTAQAGYPAAAANNRTPGSAYRDDDWRLPQHQRTQQAPQRQDYPYKLADNFSALRQKVQHPTDIQYI